MLRFTIRDVAGVTFTAAVVILITVATVALNWRQNHPATRAGQVRRGLERISREAAKRDHEIGELLRSQ